MSAASSDADDGADVNDSISSHENSNASTAKESSLNEDDVVLVVPPIGDGDGEVGGPLGLPSGDPISVDKFRQRVRHIIPALRLLRMEHKAKNQVLLKETSSKKLISKLTTNTLLSVAEKEHGHEKSSRALSIDRTNQLERDRAEFVKRHSKFDPSKVLRQYELAADDASSSSESDDTDSLEFSDIEASDPEVQNELCPGGLDNKEFGTDVLRRYAKGLNVCNLTPRSAARAQMSGKEMFNEALEQCEREVKLTLPPLQVRKAKGNVARSKIAKLAAVAKAPITSQALLANVKSAQRARKNRNLASAESGKSRGMQADMTESNVALGLANWLDDDGRITGKDVRARVEDLKRSYIYRMQSGDMQRCAVSEPVVFDLCIAKCYDQKKKMTQEVYVRFLKIVMKSCMYRRFCMPSQAFGLESAVQISRLIAYSNLVFVDVSGNQLRDYGAIAIATGIRKNNTVVHLDVRSNHIGPVGCINILTAVAANNTLTSLYMGMSSAGAAQPNFMGLTGCSAAQYLLAETQTLSVLELSATGIGGEPESTALLSMGLLQTTSLQVLNLEQNHIVGVDGVKPLVFALRDSNANPLRSLNLSRNQLDDEGAAFLLCSLRDMHYPIEELYLSAVGMGDSANKFAGSFITTAEKLIVLDLSHNNINDECMKRISTSLKINHVLERLIISNCDIGDNGFTALAEAVKQNSTLEYLDISSNRMTNGSAVAFSVGLQYNGGLKELNMSCNLIGEGGGKAIAAHLAKNKGRLRVLNLYQNKFYLVGYDEVYDPTERRGEPDVVGRAFQKCLDTNTRLLRVDLRKNGLSYSLLKSINSKLRGNRKDEQEGRKGTLHERLKDLKLYTTAPRWNTLSYVRSESSVDQYHAAKVLEEEYEELSNTYETVQESHDNVLHNGHAEISVLQRRQQNLHDISTEWDKVLRGFRKANKYAIWEMQRTLRKLQASKHRMPSADSRGMSGYRLGSIPTMGSSTSNSSTYKDDIFNM